ncbi:Dipeptide-binding ABC transporter, periplasmic substrate-binding component (TC 3.A.1.5.2) [hydrothermal vent metagenome]|uniref:Dipeptide-binding ABC transporter, periplasmic substrate-binding component (TC 3.A.1.5.2) n=1 Tax=hydrothermal vent metagenome TaxID=652676 RepID=A0A3B0YKU8_9ZZZZ
MLMRLLILCLAFWLVGCDSPPDKTAIRFALATVPSSLDPRYATDATSERINHLLYARLVDFDEQFRPIPSLASWKQLSATHYRFSLREQGRVFHDGTRLRARDVAATYRSILDRDTASPYYGTLKLIQRIEVIDDDTVDFYLHDPAPLFPAWLSVGILPAAVIEAELPVHHQPLGSGPFRFIRWPQAGRLELERISDGQRLVFEQVHDPTMRVLKLLRGEVDLLQNDLPPELLGWLDGHSGIQVASRPGSNFSYLGFQMQDAATGQLSVRRAVALAIDRQAIIRYVFRGAARRASALLPPEHWAGTALPFIERDVPRARALLQEAGYGPDNPLRLVYKTSSDPFRIRLATVLQQQLGEAGIEVSVSSYDWGTFFGDIKAGRFQLYSLAWVGIKSPDIFRYAFHSASLSPAGANRGRFLDSRADSLIDAAMQQSDLQQQADLYRQLQQHLLEQLPYVPLWFESQYFAARDDIVGYRLAADGSFDALSRVARH